MKLKSILLDNTTYNTKIYSHKNGKNSTYESTEYEKKYALLIPNPECIKIKYPAKALSILGE
jgi:hypothetical protein